jgi:hypothetical protein
MTDKRVAEAAELYEQGWSLARLGKHYDVDPQTIRKELLAAGLTIRPRR